MFRSVSKLPARLTVLSTMRKPLILSGVAALVAVGAAALMAAQKSAVSSAGLLPAGAWATDSTWHDGLVEKATYDATMVLYGRPRSYEATFLTNKEQHTPSVWSKAAGAGETVEVWKHNQIEVVPTPNYDYKFVTTGHAVVDDLSLTRLDATSQEWCGTSFKQIERNADDGLDYFAFSYMPEAGRVQETVSGTADVVPMDLLPLVLRAYDFQNRPEVTLRVVPTQKSNRHVSAQPFDATVRFAEEHEAGYDLELLRGGEVIGTYTFANDRQHVMLAYDGADGTSYRLTDLDRVDYWTIRE
jgi:hypothetical protein